MIGATEIIIILVVAGIIFLGGRKIEELGRALGRFTGEFKKGKMEVEKELKEIKKEIEETPKDESK
jgi:sec-independent protein translocase protein TatA